MSAIDQHWTAGAKHCFSTKQDCSTCDNFKALLMHPSRTDHLKCNMPDTIENLIERRERKEAQLDAIKPHPDSPGAFIVEDSSYALYPKVPMIHDLRTGKQIYYRVIRAGQFGYRLIHLRTDKPVRVGKHITKFLIQYHLDRLPTM